MGEALTIEARHERGYPVVTVAGEIDIATAARLRERSLSNPMRHQAAWFFCDVTFVSMVAGGWLIQTLAGRGGGAGGRRNRLGLAA
jgi:hypothetical protein